MKTYSASQEVEVPQKSPREIVEFIKSGNARCYYTNEIITIDNLHALFAEENGDYHYCSNSDLAKKMYRSNF